MRFTFTIDVEAEHTEGKFASHDELAEKITEAIESADPGSLEGDEGGTYDVTSWEVSSELTESEAKKIMARVRRQQKLLDQERAALEKLRGQVPTSVWIVTDRDEAKRAEEEGEYPAIGWGLHLTEAGAKANAMSHSSWAAVVEVDLEP